MSGEKCQTCGPNSVEQHPRQPAVTRCANCKEWLTTPTPEPSEVAETKAGERECLAGPACPRVQHADACRPVCGFARTAEPDAGEVDHIVTLHDKVTGLVWSCACGATGAGDRQRVIEAARQHASDWLAAHVSAAEAKARADERERIAQAIEHGKQTWAEYPVAQMALRDAQHIARGDAR